MKYVLHGFLIALTATSTVSLHAITSPKYTINNRTGNYSYEGFTGGNWKEPSTHSIDFFDVEHDKYYIAPYHYNSSTINKDSVRWTYKDGGVEILLVSVVLDSKGSPKVGPIVVQNRSSATIEPKTMEGGSECAVGVEINNKYYSLREDENKVCYDKTIIITGNSSEFYVEYQ